MIRKVVILAITGLVLIVFYNLITQISDSLRSSERLAAQAETVNKLELESRLLKEKLNNTESPEFIEEQARNKLGLSKSGETIVIIPDEKLKQVLIASESAEEVRLPNWQGWLKVFWH